MGHGYFDNFLIINIRVIYSRKHMCVSEFQADCLNIGLPFLPERRAKNEQGRMLSESVSSQSFPQGLAPPGDPFASAWNWLRGVKIYFFFLFAINFSAHTHTRKKKRTFINMCPIASIFE